MLLSISGKECPAADGVAPIGFVKGRMLEELQAAPTKGVRLQRLVSP